MINQDLLKEYKELNWNSLLRKELWEYSLEEARPIFERIRKFFDSILANPELNNLAQSIHNEIDSQLRGFLQFCKNQISTYQNISEKNQRIDGVRSREHEIINALWKFASYFAELDPKKDKENKAHAEEARALIKEIENILSETKRLSERAKQVAQKEEIQSFGNFFGNTAVENGRSANRAFWLMTILVVFTGIVAFAFLWNIRLSWNSETNFIKNILEIIASQWLLEKLVIISLLGYAIAHFSKVYSAEKHLFVLNTQRQNALNSHKQILESVQSTQSENDLETQNAILFQMTKSIFENQDTWYLKDVGHSPIISNQILEAGKILSK